MAQIVRGADNSMSIHRDVEDWRYPLHHWEKHLVYWFDASITDGMGLFENQLRSWLDITGKVLLSRSDQGSKPVYYNDKKAAIEGGKGRLLVSNRLNFTSNTERLFWCAVSWKTLTVDNAPCSMNNNLAFPVVKDEQVGAYMGSPKRHSSNFLPTETDPYQVNTFAFRFRPDGSVDSWINGFQLDTRYGEYNYLPHGYCSVGGLTTGVFASDGFTYELGAVCAPSITDEEITDLNKLLDTKYRQV